MQFTEAIAKARTNIEKAENLTDKPYLLTMLDKLEAKYAPTGCSYEKLMENLTFRIEVSNIETVGRKQLGKKTDWEAIKRRLDIQNSIAKSIGVTSRMVIKDVKPEDKYKGTCDCCGKTDVMICDAEYCDSCCDGKHVAAEIPGVDL